MSHIISDQFELKFITDVNFITLGSKCYYRWDLYYASVQMLLQMGPLLRLGPNVIIDGTFITLGSIYYAWVHLLHLCLLQASDSPCSPEEFAEDTSYQEKDQLNMHKHL